MLLWLSRHEMTFSEFISWGLRTGWLLDCGQDREGPLAGEGKLL
jgi:hypothetical protein